MAVPPSDFIIQEELERRILHSLSGEWESARWFLSPFDREKFRKPLFSIRGMNSKSGYCSEEKNETCLSRKLVITHSCDAVRELLLHEMAHQFPEQVL
ncbi:MAG: hypothetical protein K8R45_03750, partial [Desulfobacterales bacterium]|nr:hypothetical protein [Desulfobacterales bacterium]